jgi:hypothetical protein
LRLVAGLAATVLIAVVFASFAMAQSPTEIGYGGVAGGVQGEVEGGGSGSSSSSGGLPFTGLDLLLMIAAGALLLGVGLVLRRSARA